MTITNVIENGFCVGCGGCKSAAPDKIAIEITDNGFYQTKISNKLTADELTSASKVCPFSDDSENEDVLSARKFSHLPHDPSIGYYSDIFTGFVNDNQLRVNSSSGGLTSWFAEKLLATDAIDSVVHVGQTNQMFEYRISKSVGELRQKSNKKSRYYPVSYGEFIDYILTTQDRILFIGIPCFVKSIRALEAQYKLTNIKFAFSLLCGHMKSAAFSECLSWQIGVPPKNLKSIDFRVKKEGKKASDYLIESTSKENHNVKAQNFSLFGSDWGHGFFKHKACDYCDDIGGELADMTFGDAWLPQYLDDYLGTNIVISRNPQLTSLLQEYKNEVTHENVSVDDFYESQAGNFRHRRDGLKVRVEHAKTWVPKKRLNLCATESDHVRQAMYLYRSVLSEKSNTLFMIAKKFKSFLLFKVLMTPYIMKYDLIRLGKRTALRFYLKKIKASLRRAK